jgi:DNA-binding IclR family transcriptional regulator
VREQGYAATVDEIEEGLAGVSVGVFNETGALLGVINVSGLSQRLDEAGRRRAVEHLRSVVDDLEAALRHGTRNAA